MSNVSLRGLAATISDLHTFFTDEKVINAGVDLIQPVGALWGQVLEIAHSFDDARMVDLPLMHIDRLAWDDRQARVLEKGIRDFREVMVKATSSKPAVDRVTVGYAVAATTNQGLLRVTREILDSTGPRNPGPYRDDPFKEIVKKVEKRRPLGATASIATARLEA